MFVTIACLDQYIKSPQNCSLLLDGQSKWSEVNFLQSWAHLYRDESIGASSTCFLLIITVPLYKT